MTTPAPSVSRLCPRLPRVRVAMIASVVLCLLPLAAARADKAQIRAVLDEMEKATLAGDKAAYLKHVSAEDAVFHKEQVNWAADFDHHKPVGFKLIIKNDQGDFGDNEARFDLTTQWAMGEDVRGAPERTLTFAVVFRKHDDAWLYCGEDWQVLEAPGVDGAAGARVKFFPGSEAYAQTIIDVLPEVRAHVDKGFEVHIDRVQEVKVYKSMRHLQHSIYLSYVDSLAGWNEPHESIKVLAGPSRNQHEAKILLAHEYGHVCTFEYGDKATDMPWWVLEGVAELATEEFDPAAADIADRMVRGWAKRDRLAPWPDMADFRKTDRKWMGNVYKQGQHMLGYISEQFGRPQRIEWLRAMAAGKTIDQASRDVLKMSFDDLDRKWRESVTPPPPPPADQNGGPAKEPAVDPAKR
ncbi:MAG: hypothetical protein AB7G11_05035 [Phycisphaerales bacterium]